MLKKLAFVIFGFSIGLYVGFDIWRTDILEPTEATEQSPSGEFMSEAACECGAVIGELRFSQHETVAPEYTPETKLDIPGGEDFLESSSIQIEEEPPDNCGARMVVKDA